MIHHRQLGKWGEDLAVSYLKQKGYAVKVTNFRTSLGEIDIVAYDGDVLCFVEVKARESMDFGGPLEAISKQKQKKMAQNAYIYMNKNNLNDIKARFDVVTIQVNQNIPTIELFKNAFELDS